MRRSLLSSVIGVILSILLLNLPILANENIDSDFPTVRFAVIGDRTGSAVPGVYEQIVGEIERMKPDFVITVGDMIEGPENNEEKIRDKWTEYLKIAANFSMPVYYTPGNNDIETDFMESYYIEYIGQPYFSFDAGNIHFIILDNSRRSTSDDLPQEQMVWLKNDLEQNADAKQCFVFCHKPFWEQSVVDGKPHSLHNLFRTYGVDAVFSGHYHKYFSGEYDNILYTNVGSSGAGISGPGPTGLEHHFVWVTVDENGIHMAPIKMGAVMPWDEVTADENNFVDIIGSESISFKRPFLVSGNDISIDTAYEVVINNISQKDRLEDSIRWAIPAGWSLEPAIKPISITPGASETYNFNITNRGALYPLPSFSINFPYGDGKTVRTVRDLSVARETICYKSNKKPKIDGVISEKLWQKPVANTLGYDGTASQIDSVEFYFSYDKENLYLASYCKDSDIKSIIVETNKHDGAVYGDDCVGFILQPNRDRDEMYLVYVNANGIIFDQKMTYNPAGYYDSDESWNSECEVKAKSGDNYWSVELKLPFSQFGSIDENNIWGLNMRRKQPRLNDAAHWQIPWRYGPEFLGRLKME